MSFQSPGGYPGRRDRHPARHLGRTAPCGSGVWRRHRNQRRRDSNLRPRVVRRLQGPEISGVQGGDVCHHRTPRNSRCAVKKVPLFATANLVDSSNPRSPDFCSCSKSCHARTYSATTHEIGQQRCLPMTQSSHASKESLMDESNLSMLRLTACQ